FESSVIKVAFYASHERKRIEIERRGSNAQSLMNVIQNLSPNQEVLNGPFKGMIYPYMLSYGSSLTPKILGTYEKELHPLFDNLLARSYANIIDIGCAEGYYAVGLALRIPSAKVYAYDTDYKALNACIEMAKVNNVSDRIITGLFCNTESLRKFNFSSKTLIICDCEGFEIDLFNDDVIPFLSTCDLLIEMHDCFNIEISSVLRNRLCRSHSITSFYSLDDIAKALTYEVPELLGYSLAEKKELLAENRASIMEWFYLTPH
ncbi:MAG: 50S ribosomal protein L11 methyltransferase, partial [Flavobacteriales bacterium]